MGMTNKEYREHEGISKSQLFKITKSPLHFKYAMDNPDDSDTPALLFGRAIHKYILEKDDFYAEFAVAPICDRRTKEGKEIYAKFVEESAGKDVISSDDFETIKAMSEVVESNPYAKKLLSGTHEESYFWTDEETGEMCKCRPDNFTEIDGTHFIVDYKTTDSAETQDFMKSAIKYGYDLQTAMYTEGMKANTGNDFEFVFVAQEKKPPYALNILVVDEDFKREGKNLFHELLKLYHECKETGNWYGYMGADEEVQSLGLPAWLKNSIDSSLQNVNVNNDNAVAE